MRLHASGNVDGLAVAIGEIDGPGKVITIYSCPGLIL